MSDADFELFSVAVFLLFTRFPFYSYVHDQVSFLHGLCKLEANEVF